MTTRSIAFKYRCVGSCLLAALIALPAQAGPEIPENLQRTYGKFAAAMVEGEASTAIGFYAEDAVVLVDHEHVYRGRPAIRDGFLRAYLENASGSDNEGSGTTIEVERAVVGEGAVTLAGSYSNPAGTAGIYSNTWRRQDDGEWKLAASVMTFETIETARSTSGEGYACTQVLGYSQTMEWFAGSSLMQDTEGGGAPAPPPLERGTFLPGWQGRFFMGAAIEDWTDPAYPGWSGPHDRAYETPANCPPDKVDRVVFNVSGPPRSLDKWAAAIGAVAEVIRSKYPAASRIVMQPVVGAPEGMCREVRAARNHPAIAEGIRLAAKRGFVEAGPEPEVSGCGQFRDRLGHLTQDGARQVHQDLKTHYGRMAGKAGA